MNLLDDTEGSALIPDPRITPTISVERAAVIVGISRASAYEAVRTGELPNIRIGRRILVPTASLLRMIGADLRARPGRPVRRRRPT